MDVSDIFSLCLVLGEGKGESEAPGGGGGARFFYENSRRGGVSRRGRGRGAGRVSAANWGRGGGLTFFFGAEMSTKLLEAIYLLSGLVTLQGRQVPGFCGLLLL